MKRISYRENLFVFLLLIISGGFHYIFPIEQPLKAEIFNELKISSRQPDLNSKTIGDRMYILNGGHFYTDGLSDLFSQFYTRSIQHIPTSYYWKYPIYKSRDEFYISSKENKHYVNIQLKNNSTIPVVSLLINPNDFFSYETGIYVKGKNAFEQKQKTFYSEPWNQSANFYTTGRESKRKVFFSIYNVKGKHRYSTYCYARVSGHATRSFPQKSLTLSSSKLIGDKKFKVDLFNDGNYYEDFVLRNGGNDNTKALFRDAFMQSYLEKLGLFTSRKQVPYNLFINGEYWGIHFLQNKFTTNYIAERFGVKKKKVSIIENWKLEDGSEKEFMDLMSFLKDKNKQVTLEEIGNYFNLENLTLYLAGEIFFANTDWPGNNIKLFKISSLSNEESKWNFAFFDLDYGLGYTGAESVEIDMFKFLENKKDYLSNLFRKLMQLPEFRNRLKAQLEKFKELTCDDINEYYNMIDSSIDMHTQRWRKPLNREEWSDNVNEVRLFIEKRYKVIENQIKAL